MEDILVVSQIIFFSVSSLAIIVFSFFMAIAFWRTIRILKTLHAIARDIHEVSDEAKERIEEITEKLSMLPILSFFISKSKRKKNSKSKVEKD